MIFNGSDRFMSLSIKHGSQRITSENLRVSKMANKMKKRNVFTDPPETKYPNLRFTPSQRIEIVRNAISKANELGLTPENCFEGWSTLPAPGDERAIEEMGESLVFPHFLVIMLHDCGMNFIRLIDNLKGFYEFLNSIDKIDRITDLCENQPLGKQTFTKIDAIIFEIDEDMNFNEIIRLSNHP